MRVDKDSIFGSILTENTAMQQVIKTAKKAARSDVSILLTGESGTGKNALSKAIHTASQRCSGPFISVNCVAIPDTLIESELFGHKKGAFTDAHSLKQGSFETANGGTLFLDEIGDMSLTAQGKILHAIDEKQFRRVGDNTLIPIDARVISATNQDLSKKIEEKAFREDLYYRMREVCLYLPPLRERKEDIPLLIKFFIGYYGHFSKKPNLKISKTALDYLTQYSWPGNIRELRNIIKAAVILCDDEMLWLEHFPFEMRFKKEAIQSPQNDFSVETALKRHFYDALEFFKWNKRKTAAALNISRPRLDRYIKKFQLKESS